MVNKNEKLHYAGHRERLRKRYIENGINALAEHEILELLLFYAFPRVDTKSLAYKLIDIYGSLRGVLSASHESLLKSGLTESSAVYLRAVFDVHDWMERNGIAGTKMTGYNEMGKLFLKELCDDKTERAVMLMLDSKDCVIGLATIGEGLFSATKINTRKIAETCIMKGVAKVAVAHNHPSGNLEASINDHAVTRSLEELFSFIDVKLIEHYIVANGDYFGMKKFVNDARSFGNDSFN